MQAARWKPSPSALGASGEKAAPERRPEPYSLRIAESGDTPPTLLALLLLALPLLLTLQKEAE
jgi:hypothetical protein